ncbi:MAG: hypothetical protein HN368_24235, partial [Spirochaetales bacterium]|nr:hypothetical protein [Spirochaetales bacterium]
LIDALHAISGFADQWIRAPESWKPDHKGLLIRFSELVRHIFALYPVPVFMDSAWFASPRPAADIQRRWFIHVGHGGNIRTAELPMRYTKKMAHFFMQAPDSFSVIEALRYGQVLALGGNTDLMHFINATQLGEKLENEGFWESVIHFFVNNPMLDFTHINPIVEFIYNRKFHAQEITQEDGTVLEAAPPDPGFDMKGRKAGPLLELVAAWHEELNREQKKASGSWEESGITPFDYIEENQNTGSVTRWTINELLTRKELIDEGKTMKHCVGSYTYSCAKGTKSVWSLRMEDLDQNGERHVLTIAVKNDIRKVVQARGKCNAMAGMRPGSREQAGVLKREEERLEVGRRIMRMWGKENNIDVPRYT